MLFLGKIKKRIGERKVKRINGRIKKIRKEISFIDERMARISLLRSNNMQLQNPQIWRLAFLDFEENLILLDLQKARLLKELKWQEHLLIKTKKSM
jgi:hypothetical protein